MATLRKASERLGELFYGQMPTKSQLSKLEDFLKEHDETTTAKIINYPIEIYGKKTAVHLATKCGSHPCLTSLLEHGGNPNAQSSESDLRQTPLHLAAGMGYSECVLKLIEYGADPSLPNQNGLKPIDLARAKDFRKCVRTFEDAKSQKIIPLKFRSIKNENRVQELHACLASNVKRFIDAYEHLMEAKFYDLSTRWLDYRQKTLLYRATELKQIDAVKIILKCSPNLPLPNLYSGDTPLLYACRKSNHETAELLLSHSPRLLLLQNKLREGMHSALHIACYNNDLQMVLLLLGYFKSLIERGTFVRYNLDFVNAMKMTPLFIACKTNCTHIIKEIICFQHEFASIPLINVNKGNGEKRRTALHAAVEQGNIDTVFMLLSNRELNVNVHAKPSIEICHLYESHKTIDCGRPLESDAVCGSAPSKLSTHFTVIRNQECVSKPRAASNPVSNSIEMFCDMQVTPMVEACIKNSKDIVEVLLKNGARDDDGLACRVCDSLNRHDLEQLILSYHCIYRESNSGSNKQTLELQWSSKKIPICSGMWLKDCSVFFPCKYGVEDPASFLSECISKFELVVIDLSENELTDVPLELFSLPNASKINLSKNKIKNLSFRDDTGLCHWKCERLKELCLSHNHLTNLPNWIWTLPKLKQLHCQDNQLVTLSLTKQELPCLLESVNASNNRIESITSAVWEIGTLVELNLSKNKLTVTNLNFPYMKVGEPSVESPQKDMLSVTSQFHSKDTPCAHFGGIEGYSLGFIRDTVLDGREHSQLMRLDLSNNDLLEFPRALPCIAPSLQELIVSHNNFEHVDIQFLPPLIKTIVAQHCNIKRFGNTLSEVQFERTIKNCYTIHDKKSSLCQHRYHKQLPFLIKLDLKGNCLEHFQVLQHRSLGTSVESAAADEHEFQVDACSSKLLYPNLRYLILDANEFIGKLNPNIGHHSKLCVLSLNDNKSLEMLPDELGMIRYLLELHISGMDNLVNLPPEYQPFENKQLKHLLNFFKARLKESDFFRSLKLFLVGKERSGKTTLQCRLRSMRVKEVLATTKSTVGIDIKEWSFCKWRSDKQKSFRFLVWDFAGQDVYHTTHECFYSKRSLYLALFRLTEDIEGIISLEPWLKNVKLRAPGCPVIIVGTHFDQVSNRRAIELGKKALEYYRDKTFFPEVIDFVSVASTQKEFLSENITIKQLKDRLYDIACHLQLDNSGHVLTYKPSMEVDSPSALLNQQIPKSYINLDAAIKRKVVDLVKNNKPPFMAQKEFYYCFHTIFDNDEELEEAVRFLSLQGSLLHFDDTHLNDLYFLDPEWLAKFMAEVISPDSPAEKCHGIISVESLMRKQSIIDHRQRIRILDKFEVALQLDDQRLLVPSFMPDICPKEFQVDEGLYNNVNHEAHQAPLRRLWFSEYIPHGFWPRLICRIVKDKNIAGVFQMLLCGSPDSDVCEFIKEGWRIWRTGISFIYKKKVLMVLTEVINAKSSDEISGVNILKEKLRIELHLYHQDCVMLCREMNFQHACVDIPRLVTHLLVMVSQHIESLVKKWFPNMLKLHNNDSLMTYVPCSECAIQNDFDDKSAKERIEGDFVVINHPVYCFSIEDNIVAGVFSGDLICPVGHTMNLRETIPDLVFVDLAVDNDTVLLDDSNKLLGAGGFGFVFEGELKSEPNETSSKHVAVKMFIKNMPQKKGLNELLQLSKKEENILYAYKEIRKEAYFLSRLSNPYITKFCGVMTNPHLCILLELAPQKSLRSRLEEYGKQKCRLEPVTFKNTALQIAAGLQYLHTSQVVHLDIKSRNILVFSFPSAHSNRTVRMRQAGDVYVKIADYGISQFSSGLTLKVDGGPCVVGTPGFIAPEVIQPRGVCKSISADKVDVFAYGMTLYEMLSFRSPLSDVTNHFRRNNLICQKKRPTLDKREEQSPVFFQELMKLCWSHDPVSRPDMHQIKTWIDEAEFEKLRAAVYLKLHSITCACICRLNSEAGFSNSQQHNIKGGFEYSTSATVSSDGCSNSNSLASDSLIVVNSISYLMVDQTISKDFREENISSEAMQTNVDVEHTQSISSSSTAVPTSSECTQLWICGVAQDQGTPKQETTLTMISYEGGHRGFFSLMAKLPKDEVSTICPVNGRVWMGTTSGKVIVLGLIATNVIHNSTHVLTNTANLPIRDILHIDYMDTVLISVRNKILSFCDTLSAESLVPKREFLLPPYSPICYKMIKVAHQNERSVEVWGLLGENSSVLRLNLKLNEVNDTQIYTGGYGLTCIAETKSKGKDSSYITRIWVSFHHTLVSFDSITGKEVYNSSEEVSHPITALLGIGSKLFVGSQDGKVVIMTADMKTVTNSMTLHWHKETVNIFLPIPKEMEPCICSEIPFNFTEENPPKPPPSTFNPYRIPNPDPNATVIASIGIGRKMYDNTFTSDSERGMSLLMWRS